MPQLYTRILGFGNQELFLISCWIVVLVMIVWTINDLMTNKDLIIGGKLIWLLVILLFPILGTLIYLYYGRSDKHLSNNR
ncbi:PLDc N-terminal domain-containing protein [Dyadobacter sp. CY356]|uniref:PLDc N-terminal domain-containing protein n=1 Tax=Dyadobacter sp. CY356 TaxID=2906442 RepID=UPI001F454338|nr:PLDc N-terminal domain-containing protein [Dyadobacter sp. CY356]MCF0054332.1 PLDc N-terminal domain-containing protein [Dyadobacter sp. CY356]